MALKLLAGFEAGLQSDSNTFGLPDGHAHESGLTAFPNRHFQVIAGKL
jgi:hypothetical protein